MMHQTLQMVRCNGDAPIYSDQSRATSIRIWIALALILGISLIVNISVMLDGPGEQDAVRILNDVLIWEKSGNLVGGEYRPKVLPLYILAIKALVHQGLAIEQILLYLTWLNAILGALILVPLFAIWKKLLSADMALATVLVTALLPCFWVSHLYAFPTLVSLFFIVSAFWLALRAHESEGPIRLLFSAAALTFSMIAGGIKADTLLIGGTFLGLLFYSKNIGVVQIGIAIVSWMAIALFPLFLYQLFFYNQLLTVGTTSDIAHNWSEKFPLALSALFSLANLKLMISSAGILIIGLMAIGAVFAMRKPRLRPFFIVVMLWALPEICFWGLRWGNSSRHMVGAYIGLAPLAVISLWTMFGSWWNRVIALILSLVINYFTMPPSASTVAPSTRLLESRRRIQEKQNQLADGALLPQSKDLATIDKPVIVVVGSWTLPYAMYYLIHDAAKIEVTTQEDMRLTYSDGRRRRVIFQYTESKREIANLVSRYGDNYSEYELWSGQYHLDCFTIKTKERPPYCKAR